MENSPLTWFPPKLLLALLYNKVHKTLKTYQKKTIRKTGNELNDSFIPNQGY